MVGCYTGNKELNTNNIDALAEKGIKFNSGYTTAPVCTPARAGLFTGIYSNTSGPWTNNVAPGSNINTMGRLFKDGGYHTTYVGKWHLDGHDYFGTGECPEEWDGKYWYDGANYLAELTDHEIELWRNSLNTAEDLRKHNIGKEFIWGHRISNRGLQFLEERDADKPFLLVLSYDEPHHPFTCPPEYVDKYEDFAYDLGEKATDTLENKPRHHKFWSKAMPSPVGEDGKYRHPMYFACNDFVDDEIGRIVDALDEKQIENTWVIYTSDHGEMMGAHRLISKGAAMYDDITRVPFIIRPPMEQAEQDRGEVNTPVSHIDLMPTMLSMAGLSVPEILHGDDISPLFKPENAENKRGIMVEFNRYEIEHDSFGGFIPVRCLVTNEYKMVLNLFVTDELYDRINDPDELNNLINEASFATIRNELHDQLLEKIFDSRDPFRTYEWAMREWRDDKEAEWMGAFRPRPKDGYAPVVRDYDTGMPTKGVHVEDKKQKF